MLIYGNEPYLICLEKKKFIAKYVNENDTFNLSIFRNKVDLEEVKTIANTYPFFSEYRVIVFDHTDILKTDIVDLLNNAPENVKFLFIEDAVDKKYKSYKWIAKNDEILICDKLKNAQLIEWISKQISLNASYLLQKTGNDMYHIQNEINKLISYCHPGEPITNDIIDMVCSDVAEDKVFDMMDAIATSNNIVALTLYNDLLDLHTPAMKTMALLKRHFNILQHLKILEKKDHKTIASLAGILQPWLINKYQMQAKYFSLQQLIAINEQLLDADTSIKAGIIKDQIALETIFCYLLTLTKSVA